MEVKHIMALSKFESRAKKELEAEGWLIDWKSSTPGKWKPRGYNQDFFGIFDLMAYSPGIIRMIAIKGQGGMPGELRKRVEDFKCGDSIVKELWTYSQPTKKGKRIKSAKYRIRKEIIE